MITSRITEGEKLKF